MYDCGFSTFGKITSISLEITVAIRDGKLMTKISGRLLRLIGPLM